MAVPKLELPKKAHIRVEEEILKLDRKLDDAHHNNCQVFEKLLNLFDQRYNLANTTYLNK